MCWHYYPYTFSSYEEYVKYLKEKGFAFDVPMTDEEKSKEIGQNWHNFDKIYPATKEQRDFLFQKMEEAGYEWDAEKKELKKIEYDATFDTVYVNGHYDSVMTYKSFDFLNKKMFDYRGLIPMGIALSATDNLYNKKG